MEEIEVIHSEKQKVINDHHNTIEKLRKQLHTSQKDGNSMSAHLDDLNANHETLLKKYRKLFSAQDILCITSLFYFKNKNIL